jgi:hypothetical protein
MAGADRLTAIMASCHADSAEFGYDIGGLPQNSGPGLAV